MNLGQFKEYLFESTMDRQLDFSTQHSNGERENVEKKSCAPLGKNSQRHYQQIGPNSGGQKVMTMKSSNQFESASLINSQGKEMVMYFKLGRLGEIECWPV